MVRAFAVGSLVALCAALLGVSLVLKQYSMIGDGLSHVGFGALGGGNCVSGSSAFCCDPGCCTCCLILRIKGNGKIKDAAIALISTTSCPWSHGDFHDDRNEYRCVQLYVRQYFGYERRRCSAECYFAGIVLVLYLLFIIKYLRSHSMKHLRRQRE